MNYVKLKLKSEPDNFHRAIPGENFDRVSSNQEIEVYEKRHGICINLSEKFRKVVDIANSRPVNFI